MAEEGPKPDVAQGVNTVWFAAFATATWLALCVGFVRLWLAGAVTVVEDNPVVRVIELGVFFCLTAWGAVRLTRELRRLGRSDGGSATPGSPDLSGRVQTSLSDEQRD
ncbi:MAG: hypothetical protein DRI39_08140 [Chloroflexi bacterium]|nr:MAG: hypothetical protein DRI39_08140 [Chloroflexota bacterium]